MRIELNVPDRVWAQVLDVAEQNYTTVAAVVEAAIRDAVRPSSITALQARARRNHILRLWGEGKTDAVIAEVTGELRQYVADTRRAAKLPPNRVGQQQNGRKTA